MNTFVNDDGIPEWDAAAKAEIKSTLADTTSVERVGDGNPTLYAFMRGKSGDPGAFDRFVDEQLIAGNMVAVVDFGAMDGMDLSLIPLGADTRFAATVKPVSEKEAEAQKDTFGLPIGLYDEPHWYNKIGLGETGGTVVMIGGAVAGIMLVGKLL